MCVSAYACVITRLELHALSSALQTGPQSGVVGRGAARLGRDGAHERPQCRVPRERARNAGWHCRGRQRSCAPNETGHAQQNGDRLTELQAGARAGQERQSRLLQRHMAEATL